jgi:hypothetical protein
MQELSWIAETVRVWSEGGDVNATFGFKMLVAFSAFIVGPSLVAVAVGAAQWHETWLGRWFGAKAPEDIWKGHANDLDNDGLTDI